jgi:hypothetical protein
MPDCTSKCSCKRPGGVFNRRLLPQILPRIGDPVMGLNRGCRFSTTRGKPSAVGAPDDAYSQAVPIKRLPPTKTLLQAVAGRGAKHSADQLGATGRQVRGMAWWSLPHFSNILILPAFWYFAIFLFSLPFPSTSLSYTDLPSVLMPRRSQAETIAEPEPGAGRWHVEG